MALADSTNPMQGVSGPGKFSKRTDLQYQSENYGDGVAYDAIKAGAPMETAGATPHATPTQVRQAAEQAPVVGLYAPTQRPEEPITHGVDIGPGAGSEALMMQSKFAQDKVSNALEKMLPYDNTGEIGILYQQALARGM